MRRSFGFSALSFLLALGCFTTVSVATVSPTTSTGRKGLRARTATGDDPSLPMWGGAPVWQAEVNLTYPDPVSTWKLHYYYDAERNASRWVHHPPQYDEMCQGLPYGSEYQCNVIFATDGWSYIQFPERNWTCKCEDKFGAVDLYWLRGGSYEGVNPTPIDGREVQHWTKQGNMLNHYYCTDDKKQLPVRYHEIWGGKPKQWDFLLDTYRTKFNRSLVDPIPGAPLCNSLPCTSFRESDTVAVTQEDVNFQS